MFQKLFTETLFKFCPLIFQQSSILDDSSQRPSRSQVKRMNFIIVMSAATQELPFKINSLMNDDGQMMRSQFIKLEVKFSIAQESSRDYF